MITTESASALGTIEGMDFATRQIMAIDATLVLASAAGRDAILSNVLATWSQKHTDELGKRRLELAERGADLDVMTAYEAAHWIAFSDRIREARTSLVEPPPAPPAPPAKRKGRADAARAH